MEKMKEDKHTVISVGVNDLRVKTGEDVFKHVR